MALRRRQRLAELRQAGVPPEKQVFHTVENPAAAGPHRGKIAPEFSILWKNGKNIFHTVEKSAAAPVLKIRKGRGFSRRADEVCLAAAAVGNQDLIFRSWRAGDRIQPLGLGGSKKLSDIFTDLKVPRAERNAWIVVECGGEIAALAGWRVSRDFAVPGPRAAALRIRFRRQAMTPRVRSS